MYYYSPLIEFAATPWHVLTFFVVLLLVMHLALVRYSTHSDVFWKKLDYVWLAAATLGIVASSAQLNRTVAQSYLERGEAARSVATYELLRRFLDGPFWVCAPRIRTEFSPPDFDAIVQEQQELCQAAKELAMLMPATLPPNIPSLETMGYKPIGKTAKYEREFVRMLEQSAENYRIQRTQYHEVVAASKQQGWELMLALLSPLLLAFALALRITKVGGEIKNARAKSGA